MKRVNVSAASLAAVLASGFMLFPDGAQADRIRNEQWHIRALKVAAANAISTGAGITVAVVDSGVAPHVDLEDNLITGASVVTSDDDGLSDPNGHGTQMASLIAAHGRPHGAGVIGIAPNAKILPIRAADAEGRGGSQASAKAIAWAITHGAKVINFSRAVAPSIALRAAIEGAGKNDVLVVAASGNKSQDVVAAYPAAIPGVLAVGASDEAGKYANLSVRSKQLQVCAPGVEIAAAKGRNTYAIGRGTSYSTAIVSGAAALVRARFPDLSAQEVIHRLTATADDIGPPGRDDECGYGVLNIVKALTANVPPLGGDTGSASAAPNPSDNPPNASAPDTDPTGNNLPGLATGIGAVILVGGLVALLLVRRRKVP